MKHISQSQWAKYKAVLDEFHNGDGLEPGVMNDDLVWIRNTGVIPRFGEDSDPKRTGTITLKCLFQYNDYRTWPMTQFTETGELDKQSEVAWCSITQLKSLNLLDEYDKLIYNPAKDIFIHRGVYYEAAGDTDAAQANKNPLLFMFVLKRVNEDGKASREN